MDFFSVGGDWVDFVDEDDSWTIFLSLFEGFSQITFGLTSHLGHDLRSIDQEEECTGFIGNGSGDQGLSWSRGTIEQDSSWRFHTQGFEELGMPERQFDHLSDGSHLLSAASNIIISNVV